MPFGTRLTLHRSQLERTHAQKIAAARSQNDREKIRELEENHQIEMDMIREEQDVHFTDQLVARAMRLRVPVPHIYNADSTESDQWYQERYCGRRSLTSRGISALRDEIRKEEKARHESRLRAGAWIAALTGLIGALTGLVSAISHLK